MTDTEAYAAPTPGVFHMHDDLSEYVCRRLRNEEVYLSRC
jgi:hypothetical protein